MGDHADDTALDADMPAVVIDAQPQCHTQPHIEKIPDADRGETDARDANLYFSLVSTDFEQVDDAAASESKTPAVVMDVTARSHTGETPERPPANTLLLRILELFEASDKPQGRWSVQKRLNLPRMPSAELSKLVSQGHLVRIQEGVYGVAGRHYAGSIQAKG